jgi:hypothetical protein
MSLKLTLKGVNEDIVEFRSGDRLTTWTRWTFNRRHQCTSVSLPMAGQRRTLFFSLSTKYLTNNVISTHALKGEVHRKCSARGLHGGLVEIFAKQYDTGSIIDVDVKTAPPALAESSIESSTDNESSTVNITLSFFDT